MPLITASLNEIPTHIFTPVVEQVTKRFISHLGVTEYFGDRIYIYYGWSTHSKITDEQNRPFVTDDGVRVTANIQMSPSSQKNDVYRFSHATAYGIGNHHIRDGNTIYNDRLNFVSITEFSMPVTIALNFEFSFVNKAYAFQLPYQLFSSYENGAIFHVSDILFDYQLPRKVFLLLSHIWKLDRLTGHDKGTSLMDYLSKNSGGLFNVLKTRGTELNHQEIVIPKHNERILSVVEYSDDKPQDNKTDRATTSMTVSVLNTIQFNIPYVLAARFPPIIQNRLIDVSHIPAYASQRWNNTPDTFERPSFDNYNKTRPIQGAWFQTPLYDDWVMPLSANVRRYTHDPLFIGAVLFENETTTPLVTKIDLNQATEEYEFSKILKLIIKEQGKRSFEPDCLFNISVFENNIALTEKEIDIDENLVITIKADYLSCHYRLVINGMRNLSYLNPDWWDLVKKYYPFLDPRYREQIKKKFENDDRFRPKKPIIDDNGDVWIDDENLGPIDQWEGEENVSPGTRIFRYWIRTFTPTTYQERDRRQDPRSK